MDAKQMLNEIRAAIPEESLSNELLVFILKYGMKVRRQALVDAAKAVCCCCQKNARIDWKEDSKLWVHWLPSYSVCLCQGIHDLIAKLDAGKWMTDVRDWAKGHPQEPNVDDSREGIYDAEVNEPIVEDVTPTVLEIDENGKVTEVNDGG